MNRPTFTINEILEKIRNADDEATKYAWGSELTRTILAKKVIHNDKRERAAKWTC